MPSSMGSIWLCVLPPRSGAALWILMKPGVKVMMEEGGSSGGVTKKFMYINRRAPYGTIYALEGLEVVLIGAAFEQDVSMVFLDDGVFQLKKGQNTEEAEMKNFFTGLPSPGDV